MRFLFAVILFSLFPRCTLAADKYSFKYGLGLVDDSLTAQVKTFSFRQEKELGLFDAHTALEGGVWTDVGTEAGRKPAVYGKLQLGIRPEAGSTYFKAFWGVAALSSKDSQLGGYFPQFALDTGFGFQGRGSFVGLNYSHISSAGLVLPNKGRDFFCFESGIFF